MMAFPSINATDPLAMFSYANTVTDGWFWPLILLTIWIIAFMGISYKTDSGKSLASSSFLTGIIAIFMYILGLITEVPLLLAMVLAIASFVMLLFDRK